MPWFRRHQHSYDQIVNPQTANTLTNELSSSPVKLQERYWDASQLRTIMSGGGVVYYMTPEVVDNFRIVPVQVQIVVRQGTVPFSSGGVNVVWGGNDVAAISLSPAAIPPGYDSVTTFTMPFGNGPYIFNYEDTLGPYMRVSQIPAPSNSNGKILIRTLYTLSPTNGGW